MPLNNSLHDAEQRKRADLAAVLLTQALQDVRALVANPESLIRWDFAFHKMKPVVDELREGYEAELAKREADKEAEFNGKTLFAGVGK